MAEKIEPTRKAIARPMAISGTVFVRLAAHIQQDRDQHDQDADDAELAVEIGVGPFADGPGDFLHPRRALRGLLHLLDQHQGVGQAGQRDKHVQDQQDFLVSGEVRADERIPELEGFRVAGSGTG